MAKKKSGSSNNSGSSRHELMEIVKILAFVALFLTVAIMVTKSIYHWAGWNWAFLGVLDLIAYLCLIFVVAVPAWWFVKGKYKAWKIVYWVCLAILIVFVVFGVGIIPWR